MWCKSACSFTCNIAAWISSLNELETSWKRVENNLEPVGQKLIDWLIDLLIDGLID